MTTATLDARLAAPAARRGPDVVSVALALAVHAGLALGPRPARAPAAEDLPAMDVTLVELPEPPAEPAEAPVEPSPDPAEHHEGPVRAAPAVARAAARVAKEAPAPAAPASPSPPIAVAPSLPAPLVFDDGDGAWGLGVTATSGAATARPGAPDGAPGGRGGAGGRGAAGPPVLVAARGSSGGARNGQPAAVIVPGACAGFFPAGAEHETAEVSLRVSVSSTGAIESVLVAREAPPGEGFAAAARQCLLSARAEAARDPDGHPLASTALVTVRFVR